jgi:hypothetical protein
MTSNGADRRPGDLLQRFLDATDEAECRRCLERLIGDHAEPIIRGILRGRYSLPRQRSYSGPQSLNEQEAEDVRSDVVALLLSRLHDVKANGAEEAIRDFGAYVAVTVHRECDRQLRRKFPQRWKLENRLHYLLTHQRSFGVWSPEGGRRTCGFAAWQDHKPVNRSRSLQQLRDHPEVFVERALRHENPAKVDPAALVAAIFDWVSGPLELDELVNIVADLWGVKPAPAPPRQSDEGPDDAAERIPDPRVSVEIEVEQRSYLQLLWGEIRELPPRQRAALLLNLTDGHGRGVIALFPLTGVATIAQIAESLGIRAGQFATLWNLLPLEDAAIAQLLGLTRQQVINLRKVARERLGRRMRINDSSR